MCAPNSDQHRKHLHSSNLVRKLGDLLLISDETIKYIVGIYAAALFHIIKNLKTIAF